MPELVVSNAALVTLHQFNSGVTFVNVLGADVAPTTTINQALANTLDAAIKAAYTSNMASHVGTAGGIASVGIRDIRSPNQAEFVGSGAGVLGTAVTEPLPKQTALVITLRTAKSGQSFRGRVYVSGWTEAANDSNGNASSAAQTAAANFITAVSNAFSGNGLFLAVVSRPAERQTVVTTTFHADGTSDVDTDVREARGGNVTRVTSITARNNVWDTQRRRAAAGSVSTFLAGAVTNHLDESGQNTELDQRAASSRAK